MLISFHTLSKDCPRRSIRQTDSNISSGSQVRTTVRKPATVASKRKQGQVCASATVTKAAAPKRKAAEVAGSSELDDEDYSPPKRRQQEPESPEQIYDDGGDELIEETEAGHLLVIHLRYYDTT